MHQRYLFFVNDMSVEPDDGELRLDEDFIHSVYAYNTAELEQYGGGIHCHEQLDLVVVCIYTRIKDYRVIENEPYRIR